MVNVGSVQDAAVEINRDAERPTRLLTTELTSPADVQTVELYGSPGEDTNPAPGTRIVVVAAGEAWKIAVAAQDQIEPTSEPGDKRLYSTGADGVAVQAEIMLYNDGRIEISNSNSSVRLDSDGAVDVEAASDLTINAPNVIITGNLTVDQTLTLTNTPGGSIDVNTHVHEHGSGPGTTAPMENV